ncbi:hypothetical protein AHAS_Ahas09G0210600 [Arachis hypogaea]
MPRMVEGGKVADLAGGGPGLAGAGAGFIEDSQKGVLRSPLEGDGLHSGDGLAEDSDHYGYQWELNTGGKGRVSGDLREAPCDVGSEAETEMSENRWSTDMQENREAWKLVVEYGAMQYDEEDDIMAILQAQNKAITQKKK